MSAESVSDVASAASPVGSDEFAALIAPLGPFEPAPRLAVAVSGGADSLALVHLADDWARAHAGRVVALIVDHRLRPESTAEARRVAASLAAGGIEAQVLTRKGGPLDRAVQAEARAARYRLLAAWCRAAGVLHLLVAHQRDDQAETFAMRLDRGSGLDGLAGMPAVDERWGLRVLRPLLTVPRARLAATLRARGLGWIEDPSNRDPRFARSRVRALMPALAEAGLDSARLARAATGFGRLRAAFDRMLAEALAATVAVHPAGFCRVDPALFRALPEPLAARALARLLVTVGGRIYPPRGARLARLAHALATGEAGMGRTLGGCLVLRRGGGWLVCREPAAVQGAMTLDAGEAALWDGRFRVAFAGESGARSITVRALGAEGWKALVRAAPDCAESPVPPVVRPSLPAFFHLDEILAVPHLGFVSGAGVSRRVSADFLPARPIGPPRFAFAGAER